MGMMGEIVATKRRSYSEIKVFLRVFLLRPFTGVLFLLICIYLFFMGPYIYRDLPVIVQILANLSWAPIYFIFLYIVSPRFTVAMIDRRVPFFLGYLFLLFIPCLAEAIFASFFFDLNRTVWETLEGGVFTLLAIAPGLALILATFHAKLERGFFVVPPVRNMWFRWQDRVLSKDSISKKKIAHLEALNQYCVIHYFPPDSPETIRCSLSDAITNYCSDKDGMRVHRSHWVKFAQIRYIKYINGNPRILLKTGETLPCNRAAYEQLKYFENFPTNTKPSADLVA